MYLRRLWFLSGMEKSQWYNPEKIKKLQMRRLSRLLRYAYKNIAYYRDIFDSVGFCPDSDLTPEAFKSIPITKKEDLIKAGTSNIFSRAEQPGNCIKKFTSGSSGQPLTILFRKNDYDALVALTVRNYRSAGLGFLSRRIEIGNPEALDGSDSFLNKLGLWQTKNISTFSSYEDTAGLINLYKPGVIAGYPSALKSLCRYIIENKISVFTPKAVFCRSELLDDETRKIIKSVFRAEVFDFFGCWETGLIAFECREHKGYHISSDTCITEFIDSQGKEVKDGEPADIICTNLYSFAMPFIRYSIGDTGVYSKSQCKCGRKLPLLAKVYGRADDCILCRDGTKIFPSSIILSFKGIEGISRYRIEQENYDSILVKLTIGRQELRQQIVKKLTSNISGILKEKINFCISIVESLELQAGGKFKTIISNIK